MREHGCCAGTALSFGTSLFVLRICLYFFLSLCFFFLYSFFFLWCSSPLMAVFWEGVGAADLHAFDSTLSRRNICRTVPCAISPHLGKNRGRILSLRKSNPERRDVSTHLVVQGCSHRLDQFERTNGRALDWHESVVVPLIDDVELAAVLSARITRMLLCLDSSQKNLHS